MVTVVQHSNESLRWGAAGTENQSRVWNWEWYPPAQPTWGSGEASWAPQRGPAEPWPKVNLAHLNYRRNLVWKCSEIHVYCQLQKCSPVTLVSGNVRCLWIFMGIFWRGAWIDGCFSLTTCVRFMCVCLCVCVHVNMSYFFCYMHNKYSEFWRLIFQNLAVYSLYVLFIIC